jgi:hypothetical protein
MQAHDVALSDRDGSAELFMPEGRGTGRATIAATTGHDIATVKTRRLDSFEFTNVGFVKIDVEGHEEAVLRGAERTLKDTLPTLVIEIEERHNPGAIARIPKALADIGYAQSYFLSGEELLPLADFDVETHQLKIGSAIDPLYVNNFLFASKPVVP